MNKNSAHEQYWKKNITYVSSLLSVWFVVSYLCSIIFVDYLDQFRFFGFKLGFWFAQQGSIIIFVVLIYVYIKLMEKLDQEFDVHED